MEWAMMPFRRYAEFGGRSTRREFWAFQLLYLVVLMVFAMLAGLSFPEEGANRPQWDT